MSWLFNLLDPAPSSSSSGSAPTSSSNHPPRSSGQNPPPNGGPASRQSGYGSSLPPSLPQPAVGGDFSRTIFNSNWGSPPGQGQSGAYLSSNGEWLPGPPPPHSQGRPQGPPSVPAASRPYYTPYYNRNHSDTPPSFAARPPSHPMYDGGSSTPEARLPLLIDLRYRLPEHRLPAPEPVAAAEVALLGSPSPGTPGLGPRRGRGVLQPKVVPDPGSATEGQVCQSGRLGLQSGRSDPRSWACPIRPASRGTRRWGSKSLEVRLHRTRWSRDTIPWKCRGSRSGLRRLLLGRLHPVPRPLDKWHRRTRDQSLRQRRRPITLRLQVPLLPSTTPSDHTSHPPLPPPQVLRPRQGRPSADAAGLHCATLPERAVSAAPSAVSSGTWSSRTELEPSRPIPVFG